MSFQQQIESVHAIQIPRALREMPQIEGWNATRSQSADGLLGEEASSLAWRKH